jgi:hypothetical protein
LSLFSTLTLCARRKLVRAGNRNEMEEIIYKLETRDRPGLLIAIMRALAAEDCRISLEGKLSQTELAQMEGVTHEETKVLKRSTLWPKLEFLVLPLTQEKLPAIEKAVVSKIAFGERGLIHVLIELNGKMAFAAYDGFQHVAVSSAVSPPLLEELIKTRVLRNYQRQPQALG